MKSVPIDNVVSICGHLEGEPRLPMELVERLKHFLLAKQSGDVVMNIKSGAVLSYSFKEVRRVATD